MSEYSIALSSIVKDLGLNVQHASRDFDTARISTADVNRPALQLAGFYDYFDPKRLQLIGRVETRYLEQLAPEERRRALERFMRFDLSALITCHGVELLPELVELSERYDRTLLTTQEDTSTFMADLISLLRSALAPRLTMHGVLVEPIHPLLKTKIEIKPVTMENGINATPTRFSQSTKNGAFSVERSLPIK